MCTDGAADHGSLYQLRNILGRTNVGKDPTRDFNAYEDFFLEVISGHIIAAFHELKTANFNPLLDWMKDDKQRKEILLKISTEIVEKFVNFSYNQSDKSTPNDQVQEYAIQVLSLGCFYLEFSDSIKEGDGERILRCWRYLLPMFWNSGRTNYANEVMKMLYQHDYELPPALKKQLLWGRCINVHGRRGKNIAADLFMEHLNRTVKECIKCLGANQTDTAILRVSHALGTLVPVLDQFDRVNNVPDISGTHTRKNPDKDIQVIVKELQKSNIFKSIPSRKHNTVPHPRNVLHGRPKKDLEEWMVKKLKISLQLYKNKHYK